MLRNKKVFTDGRNKEILEKVFAMGNVWSSGGQEIGLLDMPFYFFDAEGYIGYASSYGYFINHNSEKITAQEILDMEVVHEFKPFDKVLVRDSDTDIWKADLFSHISETGIFICVGNQWIKCIPFNEDKVGKP